MTEEEFMEYFRKITEKYPPETSPERDPNFIYDDGVDIWEFNHGIGVTYLPKNDSEKPNEAAER